MLLGLSVLFFSLINSCIACPGCVDLDELTFEKTMVKFKTALVKFDQAFPYGDNHEAYAAFSRQISNTTLSEATNHPEVLIATIGIKDYGDQENKKIADKYGITVDSLPVIKIFNDGNLDRSVDFDLGTDKLTVSRLFLFVKRHAAAYIQAPGCVPELDDLATQFMEERVDRKSILERASKAIENIKTKKSMAEFYKTLMKNLIEKGDEFIILQRDRMTKLLKDKISEKKSLEIEKKLNILMSFEKHLKNADDNNGVLNEEL